MLSLSRLCSIEAVNQADVLEMHSRSSSVMVQVIDRIVEPHQIALPYGIWIHP